MSESCKFYLFKRPNGYWYILYEQGNRRRWKSTRAVRKRDAHKVLTNFRQSLKAAPKTLTLSQFMKDYLDYARVNYAKATIDINTIALNHLRTIAGDCMLNILTPQHLDRYKTKRLGEISPVSVNVELRALRAIMNVAVRWQLLESNPLANLQLVRTADVPPAYFRKVEFQKLISVIEEGWLREIVIFAALTGLRRGEIINLGWQSVDLSRKLLYIESNPTFKTKQGKRRVVPINDVAFQLLSAKAGRSTCEFVFTKKGRKIKGDHLCKKLKGYVRAIGLDGNLHFHSLRHSFASWLVQDGVSLCEVQKLLGHSNIAVTQVYSHLQPEHLHNTVNKITVTLN